MRPPIKYVLDVTIAYPHKMPLSLFTLSFGTREPCDIGVYYKIYDASDVSIYQLLHCYDCHIYHS